MRNAWFKWLCRLPHADTTVMTMSPGTLFTPHNMRSNVRLA
ncbi:unnamed protein product [Ixodes persulcatus]